MEIHELGFSILHLTLLLVVVKFKTPLVPPEGAEIEFVFKAIVSATPPPPEPPPPFPVPVRDRSWLGEMVADLSVVLDLKSLKPANASSEGEIIAA